MSAACDEPRRALIAAIFTAAPSGSFYGFSIYSQALKVKFDLSQQQLANINTIPYALGFVGALAGAVVHSCGPSFATTVGGVIQTSGQLLMFSVAAGVVPTTNPPVALVLCACVTYTGMMLNSAVAFSTPVLHYPRNRSSMIALVKSFVGIAGAVVTQVRLTRLRLRGTPAAGLVRRPPHPPAALPRRRLCSSMARPAPTRRRSCAWSCGPPRRRPRVPLAP